MMKNPTRTQKTVMPIRARSQGNGGNAKDADVVVVDDVHTAAMELAWW